MKLVTEKGQKLVYLGKEIIEGSKGTFSLCKFADPDTYESVTFFMDRECKLDAQEGDQVKITIKVTGGRRTYYSLIEVKKV